MSAALCHWQEDGPADAPPVLLLHPIATHGGIWALQVPAWSQRLRVIRIDLPGHGRSALPHGAPLMADYADAVAAVLDALNIASAGIVGLSLGGMVAQALALRHAGRVDALVLAHTSACTAEPVRQLWETRLEQCRDAGFAAQIEPTLQRWFTPAFAASSPLALDWVRGIVRATAPAGYMAAARAIQQLDHLAQLPSIRCPTLVLAGEADAAVPPAMAADIAQRIPGAQWALLPGAPHIGNVEQPGRFTETVGAFLHQALHPALPRV